MSRSAIKIESLSGDEERSGDSGDDRGGVSNGSAPAKAASTRRTKSLDESKDGLKIIKEKKINIKEIYIKNKRNLT